MHSREYTMRSIIFSIIIALLITVPCYGQPLCVLFNSMLALKNSDTAKIRFPQKISRQTIDDIGPDLIEGALRAYVLSLMNNLVRTTGFSKANLGKPFILFKAAKDFGATIETLVDARKRPLHYTITFYLGVDNEKNLATILSMVDFLDYLGITQFAHALFNDEFMNPDFSQPIEKGNGRYSISVPSFPQLSIKISDEVKYGARLCAMDKFTFALGGSRVKESYLAFSRQLRFEKLRKYSLDEFVILVNHIAVLEELGEKELANKIREKVTLWFSNEDYFGQLERIIMLYHTYYKRTRVEFEK